MPVLPRALFRLLTSCHSTSGQLDSGQLGMIKLIKLIIIPNPPFTRLINDGCSPGHMPAIQFFQNTDRPCVAVRGSVRTLVPGCAGVRWAVRRWREAGEFARLLTGLYYMRFVSSPLKATCSIKLTGNGRISLGNSFCSWSRPVPWQPEATGTPPGLVLAYSRQAMLPCTLSICRSRFAQASADE